MWRLMQIRDESDEFPEDLNDLEVLGLLSVLARNIEQERGEKNNIYAETLRKIQLHVSFYTQGY